MKLLYYYCVYLYIVKPTSHRALAPNDPPIIDHLKLQTRARSHPSAAIAHRCRNISPHPWRHQSTHFSLSLDDYYLRPAVSAAHARRYNRYIYTRGPEIILARAGSFRGTSGRSTRRVTKRRKMPSEDGKGRERARVLSE